VLKAYRRATYHKEVNGKLHSFDSKECVKTYKKLKSVYGEKFE